MAGVVGLTVWVKLKHPPSTGVLGIVKDIVPNSHITLNNVFFPESNTRWEAWTVQATAIEDLQVVDPSAIPQPHPPPPHHPHVLPMRPSTDIESGMNMSMPPPHPNSFAPQNHTPYAQPAPQPNGRQSSNPAHHPPFSAPVQPQFDRIAELPDGSRPTSASNSSALAPAQPRQSSASPAFVDPAIVSFDTTASPVRRGTSRPSDIETPIKSMLSKAAANLPSPGSPFIGDAGKANVAQKLASARQNAIGTQPQQPQVPVASKPTVEVAPGDSTQDVAPQENGGAKKKIRRGQRSKKPTVPTLETADPPLVMNAEVSRNGNDMNGQIKRGKGWRSTPLLQPSPSTTGPLDKANTKKSRRKQRDERTQEFAQGDTTDIQDMGDFDFEGELKKFDKKTVFDEIRQGDTTADEDRLVSHNKARPGTHGGKNLHPSENVLSPKLEPKHNGNELDSSSDADTELNFANGRSSSKHSVSRTVFPKTRPSRQNSTQVEPRPVLHPHPHPHPQSLAASFSSDRARNRSTTSLVARNKQAASLATSSPRPEHRPHSPHSVLSASRATFHDMLHVPNPHFAIQTGMTICPTLLPGALHQLEAVTVSMYGLTHESITETAARCIAEAALQLSDSYGGIRRTSRTNTIRGSMTGSMTLGSSSEPSTIVVLAGNHEIGARALAAARHLLGRNVKVIAAEGSYETAEAQDHQAKAQISILKKMTHGGAKIKRGVWAKAQRHIKNLTGPPAVIIDALLAGSTYERLLDSNADFSDRVQQETREMIEWANRSRAPVLSIGCPSGMSGIDGLSTIVEGEPLAVRPEKVLALGAPMQGLLKALEGGEKFHVSAADIGINIGLKADEQVAFGGSWTVDLKFMDGDEAVTS